MKKNLLLSAAAAFLCIGVLTACGSTTPQNNDVTITVKTPIIRLSPDFDSDVESTYDFLLKAASAFEEEHADDGITVDVLQFDATNQASAFDSDTEAAADVLYGDFFNIESYVYTGRTVPLDDIITDEIRADISDTFWSMCTMEGKTYMLPFLYRQNVLGFNKELFRECGLEKYCGSSDAVQTWTLDEWDEVLKTLKEGLPENKYAMMLYAGSNQGDTHIMSLIRSRGSSFFDESGRLALNTPEGIAGLKWIKNLQTEGYAPPNADKLEILDNNDLFLNGQLAIYVVNDATEAGIDFECGFVNFPSEDGGISTNFNSGFEVFDNGDAAKLSAAKAFVKYIYESDWLDYSEGSIPCSSKVAEKYSKELTGIHKYLDNADTGVRFTGGNPNWIGVREAFYPCIQKLLTGEYTAEEAAAAIDSACNAAIEEGYAGSTLHE